MDFQHLYPGLIRIGIACAAIALAPAARAAEPGFSKGLSAEERAACGIPGLTAPQVAALDALVEHDVTLARQGGVTGFSSAFAARHTERERAAAGIDRLSEKERSALDSLAARAIAMGPPPSQAFEYVPAPPTPPEPLVSAPPAAQVHGDLSFTVGGGSHGSGFYGASMDMYVTDPSGRFTVGVGVAEYRGRGFLGPYGPYCPPYAGPFLPGF
ncbi:MAG TPA: hypothetical protein VN775_05620 [Opitutaceae bacterium]|nr:hypothetical protein [Opitutaceae bacterium]